MYADNVDNMAVQELQESKKDSKDSTLESNTESTAESSKTDSNNKDLESNVANLEHKMQENKKKKPMQWFIGGYVGTFYNAKYNGEQADTFILSLLGGLYYKVGVNHGLRGFALGSYGSINRVEIFSAGIGVDYFYDFKSGFKIFGGAQGEYPFKNFSPSLLIYAGFGGFVAKSHYLDLRVGYPIAQDSKLSKSVTIGISYQYLFKP